MLIFSAARGSRDDKKYYKDFHPEQDTMANMGHYLRKYAISSYLYGDGYTDTTPAEFCHGHRAWSDVNGFGNILLFDFDSKVTKVDFKLLAEKFKGVSSYIAPSKSWSDELEKYHVVVELSEDVPSTRDAFKTLYRAAAQWLDIEGLYDATMESATQQMSPHHRTDAPELHINGAALNVTEVLAHYTPLEGQESGKTFGGFIEDDTVFTLSRTGEAVTVEEMISLVDSAGKQRVHCVSGFEHDGRRDTAFVTSSDSGYIYACSGGRCQHTLSLRVNPFTVQKMPTTVVTKKKSLFDIIADHPVIGRVYTKEKPTAGDYESAVQYGLDEQRS